MALSGVANTKVEEDGTKVVNFSLGLSTVKALQEQKKSEGGRAMSRIVEQAILEYIERKKAQ